MSSIVALKGIQNKQSIKPLSSSSSPSAISSKSASLHRLFPGTVQSNTGKPVFSPTIADDDWNPV